MKICTGKVVLFAWAQMKLHLLVYRETVRHFERKESVGKVCALGRRVHVQFCYKYMQQEIPCMTVTGVRYSVWNDLVC
jgi:hypothetical protein